ncbi:hypothetical protein HPP92_002824 [Vanilla planifolia]|uniref:FAF domain-containing protein n=1 Tax=Vanilla planifolia TaxID=51239 RepID=A0A835SEG3_VANPL|nr:hypothetical protein HPP92_002824 [Vanilla planifolia]
MDITKNPKQDSLPEPSSSSSLNTLGDLCPNSSPFIPPFTEPPPSHYPCDETISGSGDKVMDTMGKEGRVGVMNRSQSTRERSVVEGKKEDVKGCIIRSYSDVRQRIGGEELRFPPPITTIGRGGKPRVYFKSFRKEGRFVLREMRIPTQRLLQATREDGRLMMRVLRSEHEESNEDGKMREDENEVEAEE